MGKKNRGKVDSDTASQTESEIASEAGSSSSRAGGGNDVGRNTNTYLADRLKATKDVYMGLRAREEAATVNEDDDTASSASSESFEWMQYFNKDYKTHYYFCPKTGKSSWEKPPLPFKPYEGSSDEESESEEENIDEVDDEEDEENGDGDVP